MPLDPWVLEILVCPVCKTKVSPVDDGAGLLCRSCRRRFPVVGDVPNMLAEEASIEPEDRS